MVVKPIPIEVGVRWREFGARVLCRRGSRMIRWGIYSILGLWCMPGFLTYLMLNSKDLESAIGAVRPLQFVILPMFADPCCQTFALSTSESTQNEHPSKQNASSLVLFR